VFTIRANELYDTTEESERITIGRILVDRDFRIARAIPRARPQMSKNVADRHRSRGFTARDTTFHTHWCLGRPRGRGPR